MKTQTAYCENCKCNVPVTHFIPKSHLAVIPVMFTIFLVLAMIIGSSIPGEIFGILFGLSFLVLAIRIPSNDFYCEKCGGRVGTSDNLRNRCVHCGAELEPSATFCPKCGRKYKQSKDSVTCKKCETENSLDAVYCVKCGTKLPSLNKKALKQHSGREKQD